MTRKLPLVVVLGATACGKSKLALELAARFGGEIISADSMQVYRGLDIATNKVSEEELKAVKHHMMSFVDPGQSYSVVDFRNRSLNIIDGIRKQNSLPIVVGGTNYYIESLLWKGFLLGASSSDNKLLSNNAEELGEDEKQQNHEGTHLIEDTNSTNTVLDAEAREFDKLSEDSIHSKEDLQDVDKFFSKKIYPTSFKNVESEKLWHILEQVDPDTAHRVHPHNRRGIIRFLQIIQEKGRKYSEILADINQSSKEGKHSLGGPLRYENTCVLWLHCENEILNRVLDERVEQMLDRGLLAELEEFHKNYNAQRAVEKEKLNYETGVFQTIGFKEFHNYLMLEPEQRITDEGQEILKKSIGEMKISTRQYVRRQIKWIRSRFLKENIRDLPDLFKLTTTFDEENWTKEVREPAFEIVQSIIEGRQLDDRLSSLKPVPIHETLPYGPGKLHCDACDRTFIGNNHIIDHLRSRKHHKILANLKRKRQRLTELIKLETKGQL